MFVGGRSAHQSTAASNASAVMIGSKKSREYLIQVCAFAGCRTPFVQVYPTPAARCVARVALFSWRFVVPLTLFVFCYWKIIAALRRTATVGNATRSITVSQRGQHTAGPSTSAADAASAEAATATSSRSKPADKTQKNVVKTMLCTHYSLAISGATGLKFTKTLQDAAESSPLLVCTSAERYPSSSRNGNAKNEEV